MCRHWLSAPLGFPRRRFNTLGYGWQKDGELKWQGIVVLVFTVIALIIMGRDWVNPEVMFTMLLAFFVAINRLVR